MASRETRLLVLCKTYPSPSARHAETSCVAAMEESGNLIRVFPVPFRLIDEAAQFKKWQWIRARIEKSKDDARPESHRIFFDTIAGDGPPVPTSGEWHLRRSLLEKLPKHDVFGALEQARNERGVTLGIVRPEKILGLDITPADRQDWTKEELAKLTQLQRQAGLFDDDAKTVKTLRKVPFDFHYRYLSGGLEYRHKLVDWEVGALYWKVRGRNGDDWQAPFRSKLEGDLPQKDLMFLMGTIHRFPDQWLIASLIYPPKQQTEPPRQGSLL